MSYEGITIADSLRLASVVATAMILLFASICSYYLEKRNNQSPMLALIFLLISWCSLTLGAATSGLGRFFPALLVAAPLLSGYIGPALFLCTKQLTAPHQKNSLKWLFLGCFGTTHSILALTMPNGLEPAIQSIVNKQPYYHPILSTIMIVHGIQLIGFIIVSTFLITRTYINKSNPEMRRTQFWLMTICWTTLVVIVFTNILPTFSVIITDIQPALILVPIAFVGLLCIKALGEETSIIQSQRIDDRNDRMESLGRMAKGLAHDLNNILSTVMGHAEIAKLKTKENEKTVSHLNQIIFGTQRAATFIERMLAYSSDQLNNSTVVDPKETIRTIFDSVATLQPSRIIMQLEIEDSLPKIQIAAAELESAIHNLLQNGVNALDNEKGKITLRASFEPSTNLPQDYIGHDINGNPALRVEVEDTGHGMNKEEASRALEPFFSTNARGKGLGLVNVLSSVKGAGGSLWFQSELNEGTRFVFWIPAANGRSIKNNGNTVNPPKTVRAILVEDDLDVAKVLLPMLNNLNIVAEHYTESEAVMNLMDKGSISKFDLGILDIRLGGVDGIELGHHLLNNHSVNAIVFISGDEPGLRIKQFEESKVRFLRKPIGMVQLEQSINELSKSQ